MSEHKFKVGDRVTNLCPCHYCMREGFAGRTGTIKRIAKGSYPYRVDIYVNRVLHKVWCAENYLELAEHRNSNV